jgi:Holliday junction resolvasome RuvABC ATP-dependent DNA helicase subunit
MAQYDVNDLLRVIGIKELAIMQLRLENLRLQQKLAQARKKPRLWSRLLKRKKERA